MRSVCGLSQPRESMGKEILLGFWLFFAGEAKWWRKHRDEKNFQNSSPLTVNQRILSKDLIRSAAGAHPDLLLPVLHRHNSPHKDIKTKCTHLSCFCSHSLGCTSQLSGYSVVNTGILPSPTERSPDTTWLLISWLHSKQHSRPSLWIVGKESGVNRGLGGKSEFCFEKQSLPLPVRARENGRDLFTSLILLIGHGLYALPRHSLSEGVTEEDQEGQLLMHW